MSNTVAKYGVAACDMTHMLSILIRKQRNDKRHFIYYQQVMWNLRRRLLGVKWLQSVAETCSRLLTRKQNCATQLSACLWQILIFWNGTPCGLVDVYWLFAKTCCLQLQSRKHLKHFCHVYRLYSCITYFFRAVSDYDVCRFVLGRFGIMNWRVTDQ